MRRNQHHLVSRIFASRRDALLYDRSITSIVCIARPGSSPSHGFVMPYTGHVTIGMGSHEADELIAGLMDTWLNQLLTSLFLSCVNSKAFLPDRMGESSQFAAPQLSTRQQYRHPHLSVTALQYRPSSGSSVQVLRVTKIDTRDIARSSQCARNVVDDGYCRRGNELKKW